MRLSIQLGGSLAILCFAVACEAKPTPAGGSGKPTAKKEASKAKPADDKKADKKAPSADDIAKSKAMAGDAKMHVPPPSDLIQLISKIKVGGKKVDLVPHVSQMSVDAKKDKAKQAFAAGVLVTDFFIYAEAKNKKEAARVAKSLGEASKRLVPKSDKIAKLGDQIGKSIDNGDWDAAMRGVDEVYGEFKAELEGTFNEDDKKGEQGVLASFVALGAWAESFYVMSAYMQTSYDENMSKFMRQADLVKLLGERVAEEDGGAFAKLLNQAVKNVEAQVSVPTEAPIPADNVKKVYEILKTTLSQA